MDSYFISGIGTDVGKTIVSAVLVEKLRADYWKPVQTGTLQDSDTQTVKSLVDQEGLVFHPESVALPDPLSPHEAAERANQTISLSNIHLPAIQNTLVIEGAGGLMVPLNEKELMFDLILAFNSELILVSKNYLGSINHTLLSLSLIKQYRIPFKGIIFSGPSNPASERIILAYSGARHLGFVPHLDPLNKQSIRKAGAAIHF